MFYGKNINLPNCKYYHWTQIDVVSNREKCFKNMNFMNVSWNGTAFAGNPIPPNKHIPESIETNSYNSAFTGDHHNNQEYNSHFEAPTDASISSSKSSPDVTRNAVRKKNVIF